MVLPKYVINRLVPLFSNMKRKYILLLSLCFLTPLTGAGSMAFAQYTREQMYRAWLHTDMSYWDRYLHATDWSVLSQEDKARYLSYEYGYVATAIDDKLPDAEQHIHAFKAHIDELSAVLPSSTITMYLSSYAAYRAKFWAKEFISQGLQAKRLAKEAAEMGPTDPLALTLSGCVDFYAPRIVGGDKERALQSFREAKALFEATGDTILNWSYASVNMQLALCLDKTGHREDAIKLCRAILLRDSDFYFIRDEYLPQLLKK